MNVLIVEKKPGSLAGLRTILATQGDEVDLVGDLKSAADAASRRRPDVSIVAWAAPAEPLHAFARHLKARGAPPVRALLAVLVDESPAARADAYGAGADDVVSAGASGMELVERVRSAQRAVRTERRLEERLSELEAGVRRLSLSARDKKGAAAEVTPIVKGLSLLLTSTWTGVEELLATTCGAYLQGHCAQVGWAPPPAGCPGAAVMLSDVDNGLGIELSFYAAPPAAKAMAAAICGDPSMVDDELTRDVMLELANTGMGAVKAAMIDEKLSFASSLPKAVVSRELDKMLKGAEARRVLTLRTDSAVFYAVLTLHRQGRTQLLGSQLREGMVLASDVTNESGVLLARAGTRLTMTGAEKLAHMVPRKPIELADVA